MIVPFLLFGRERSLKPWENLFFHVAGFAGLNQIQQHSIKPFL